MEAKLAVEEEKKDTTGDFAESVNLVSEVVQDAVKSEHYLEALLGLQVLTQAKDKENEAKRLSLQESQVKLQESQVKLQETQVAFLKILGKGDSFDNLYQTIFRYSNYYL